jgi:hypothetical protein
MCQLHVATLREVYSEVKKQNGLALLVENVKNFKDISELKKP